MPHENEKLITGFYTAFREKHHQRMQNSYHDEAVFSDPVFKDLRAREVRAMWEMLLRGAHDLEVTFRDVRADELRGSCHWEATYTFSLTGRKVHNVIEASFEFRNSKIYRHTDRFNFWRWSAMALGVKGVLLGWSPLVKNKVRGAARKRLDSFMNAVPV
jgi:hypothetical protein